MSSGKRVRRRDGRVNQGGSTSSVAHDALREIDADVLAAVCHRLRVSLSESQSSRSWSDTAFVDGEATDQIPVLSFKARGRRGVILRCHASPSSFSAVGSETDPTTMMMRSPRDDGDNDGLGRALRIDCAVKLRKSMSPHDSLSNEAVMLRTANASGIGPRLLAAWSLRDLTLSTGHSSTATDDAANDRSDDRSTERDVDAIPIECLVTEWVGGVPFAVFLEGLPRSVPEYIDYAECRASVGGDADSDSALGAPGRSSSLALAAVAELLRQSAVLDARGLSKGEMTHQPKHVFVDYVSPSRITQRRCEPGSGDAVQSQEVAPNARTAAGGCGVRVTMLDFDRAASVSLPCTVNVPRTAQYLSSGRVLGLLRDCGVAVDITALRDACSRYRHSDGPANTTAFQDIGACFQATNST